MELVPILSQMNPDHSFLHHFSGIHSIIVQNICKVIPVLFFSWALPHEGVLGSGGIG
jgi:hypothetical protein